jgi:hypothetical protein
VLPRAGTFADFASERAREAGLIRETDINGDLGE